jgi:hypothetical protein
VTCVAEQLILQEGSEEEMSRYKANLSIRRLIKNRCTWKAAMMICIILLTFGFALYISANVNSDLESRLSAIEKALNMPIDNSLSPFRKSNSFIVSLVGTFARLQNGSNGAILEYGANHTVIIQDALGNASDVGGSVYISEGSYSAAVVLQNNTRLVIDKGAKGISYTVASEAYCILDDFNTGLVEYFSNGYPLTVYNYASGTLLMSSENLTSIYCGTLDQLINGQGVKLLHLVVENGVSFPTSPVDKQVFFRSDLGYLYVYDNNLWTQIGTIAYGNLTGIPDLTVYLTKNGLTALTGDWNLGGSYGIYGASWVNSTSLNLYGQLWWDGQNRTDILAHPVETASYVIFTDFLGNYFCRNGRTGQIDYSSTNVSYVLNSIINAGANDIYFKEGIYNFTNPIILYGKSARSSITLRGAGSALSSDETTKTYMATILRLANGANCDLIKSHADVTDAMDAKWGVSIKDLAIDGNHENNPSGSCGIYGVFTDLDLDHILVQDCLLDGIRLIRGATDQGHVNVAKLWDVHSNGNVQCGFNITEGPTDSIAYFLWASGNGMYGLYVYNTGNVDVIGGHIFDNKFANVYLKFSPTCIFDSVVFEKPHGGASGWSNSSVTLEASHSCSFVGCTFYGNGYGTYDQLTLDTCSNCSIIGNQFDPLATNKPRYDLTLLNGGDRNIVSDNNFQAYTKAAVHLEDVQIQLYLKSNLGYNPLGVINNQTIASENYLVDSGGDTAIASGNTYTCSGSDKTIYIIGGEVTEVDINGQTLFGGVTNISVFVPSGATFRILWAVQPTLGIVGS